MIKNYIKIAWRNLIKNRVFTSSNVVGLSLAFCVAILLSMAAVRELSYDRFHENASSLYQLYSEDQNPTDKEVSTTFSIPCGPSLKAEVSGIRNLTRMTAAKPVAKHGDNEFSLSMTYVDSSFLDMFTFPTLTGESSDALKGKESVVITQKTALKIFGTEDVVGEVIDLAYGMKNSSHTISAVLVDLPATSSITFDGLLLLANHPLYQDYKNEWNHENMEIFVQLEPEITPTAFETNSIGFSEGHNAEYIEYLKEQGAEANAYGNYFQLHLNPIKNRQLSKYDSGELVIQNTQIYLLLLMALLILLTACVNYINMSVASGLKRLKEIGMRKTLGALKSQLFIQFWSESLFTFIISIALGLILSHMCLGTLNEMLRSDLTLTYLLTPKVFFWSCISVLILTFIAGGYPAILLSKLGTLQALKGKLEIKRNNTARNVLIVSQFTIAIFLLSGTFTFNKQLDFMRNKDLGFNKEQVITFPIGSCENPKKTIDLLRNQLKSETGIISVSASSNNLGRGEDGSMFTSQIGFGFKEKTLSTHLLVVDYDYVETLDLDMESGRSFNKTYGADSLGVIINETMAATLGEENPLEQTFNLNDVVYPIIGVVKDYNFQNLTNEIEPISMFLYSSQKAWGDVQYAYIKVAPKNLSASYETVESTWKTLEPEAEFLGSFLDENVERLFTKEKILTSFITFGALIAIIISCIGLFAVSLMVVSQRTKEIGVRKVIGATSSSVAILLTKDFLKLILIAFLIAAPLSYLMLSKWLGTYAYHTALSPVSILLTGFLTALIATLTIGSKTILAARENPVKSLRSE
ncbi:MAG: ABC transporter permease [Flavobacteriales bacterium]